ncbi:MAG: winged helix-turn-helix domain-containing protein [Saprospiraceae bacterium]
MKRNVEIYRIILAPILICLCVWPSHSRADSRSEQTFQVNANLAIREVAHILLQQLCDSTSNIPPVEFHKNKGYYLTFDAKLDYAQLKPVMDEVFRKRNLPLTYNLALFDCEVDGLVLLGFSAVEGESTESPTCLGRDEIANCYQIAVNFPSNPVENTLDFGWLALFPLLALLGGGYWWWQSGRQKQEASVLVNLPVKERDAVYQLGKLYFDPINQMITGVVAPQQLTFREAKLLDLFCQNKNQLLPREEILEYVWGDEGVIVGRSVDVFVSRLRKKLKPDNNIKITSVHGVGYRLEIPTLIAAKALENKGVKFLLNEN